MQQHSYQEFDLSNGVAIVTGAGRGIGFHLGLALARYGADVVVCGRTRSELEKAASEIERMGRRCLIQQMDVLKIPDIHTMVEASLRTFGHIDILVNNAGINIPQWAEEVTEEAWDKIIDTNLKGLFFCAQAVGKVMIQQKRGKIINISSDAGSVGLPQRAAYCSSKAGVDILTKVLAIEWGKYHINVNSIAPTFIETPFTKSMFEKEGFREYALSNILLGRIGQPQDVVGAAIYLASGASDFVTGHVLLVDAGWTAH